MSRTVKVIVGIAVAIALLLTLMVFLNFGGREAVAKPKPTPSPTVPPPVEDGEYTEEELIELNTPASFTVTEDDQGENGNGQRRSKRFSDTVSAAAGCRSVSKTVNVQNGVGNFLYAFTGTSYWCWNTSGKVTSVQWGQSGRTGNQLWNTWRYDGVSSVTPGGCVGCNYVYRRVNGAFHACFTWYCQYDYPYVSITARGDGTATTGGGLGG